MICARCRAENTDGAHFCNQCGARLVAEGAADATLAAPFHGERRQLTALFCDLVGSTELANAHDPEEHHDIIRDFVRCCTLQLRAALGLSRMLAARGDPAAAYALLADVHSRVSEGFATRDLIEAARQRDGLGPIEAAGLAAISPN